ncbi:TIGR02677 family protein [Streptomyces sp. NPDC005507]|uniref:TIGR02677 family protein n=1 Tax=Streptomyces sp. NPDC005507 TaxID=3154885 RepID=UPI0033B9387F
MSASFESPPPAVAAGASNGPPLSSPAGTPKGGPDSGSGNDAFGIDAFTLDDRLRLFHFAAAEKRGDYLWLLRAFDRGRANYQVLLHASDAAGLLRALADEHPGAAAVGEVQPLLDALAEWKVLDRSYDGTRAANLTEYRNRHYVYQFTQAGYRAYRAVEDVLGATLEDAQLSRLVFPDLLADLTALAEANAAGDAEEVYRKLGRLDSQLNEMAQRAARFYLMLGDLARTNDTRPEVFLAHKDALLSHMREFTAELGRYAPLLAEAVEKVAVGGVERMVEQAAEADERLFRSPAARLEDWRQRWNGIVHWFGGREYGRDTGREHSEAERLQDATVTAIRSVLALLRRVTEARRGGVSRESELRHLAQWFTSAASDDDAHALFQAVFGLGAPRHVAVPYSDPELIPGRTSWWEAEPVELARTLVQSGRTPALRGPGRVERNDAERARLRATQLRDQAERRGAAVSLARDGAHGRVLDEAETSALLSLLDVALAARVPVTKGVTAASGAAHGVRLTLVPTTSPGESFTTVRTVRGDLHLDGLRLEVAG